MNRLSQLPRPRPETGVSRPSAERRIAIPPHIEEVLEQISTRFATAREEREWDRHDTLAYAKVLAPLQPAQCRRLVQLLRERHVFRPMVAEVKAAVDEVIGANAAVVSAADAQARTVVRRPLALPPHPDNPGRREFWAALDRMRRGERPGPDTGLGGEG